MQRIKRVSSLVIAIALSVSVFSVSLVGCGKETEKAVESSAVSSAVESTQQATETKALEPVKLKWYILNPPQKDSATVYEAANKLISEKINATVDFQPLDYGVMEDKMKVIIASGEEYDLCFTSDWLNNYFSNVAKNAYKDIGGLLDEYAPNLKKSISEKVWQGGMVNGKIYGVPNMQIMVTYRGVGLHKGLIDKYKMDVSNIKTVKDLEPLLETIKKNEPKVFPLTEPLYAGTFSTADMVIPMADNLLNVDRNAKASLIDTLPQEKERKDLMISWIKKGLVMDLNSKKNKEAYMKEGRAFAWFATIKPGGEAEFKANNGYECVNIPLEEPYIDTHACTSTMNAVGINSKNPERAVMLLDMVNSDKALYNLLSFGIENVNYKKVADNKIELIADSGYTGTSWATGNVFNSYLLPGQADDVWEQTIALNNSAVDAPGLGFTFNQDPIKAEMAAVVAVRGQYENLEYATDVDYWKKLEERNAKYKASGLDKIQAEMQKQLDAWKAATGK